jgi:hypothetical protein
MIQLFGEAVAGDSFLFGPSFTPLAKRIWTDSQIRLNRSKMDPKLPSSLEICCHAQHTPYLTMW